MRRERWEDICNRCGQCCFERDLVGGGVLIDLRRPCTYLDSETNHCTVYGRRFKVAAYCSKVTLFHALFARRMPLDCGYVVRFRKRTTTECDGE